MSPQWISWVSLPPSFDTTSLPIPSFLHPQREICPVCSECGRIQRDSGGCVICPVDDMICPVDGLRGRLRDLPSGWIKREVA
jgi:hypothetical protein